MDPRELWAVAEAAERRKDSTVAREFEVSLPHELSEEQRAHLAFVIADALVDRYGFAVQASIHLPETPDGLNHHVHILATTRRLGPERFGDKTRELDVGPSGKVQVQWIREMVAATTNAHLEAAGHTSTIDHRSLAEQARSTRYSRSEWTLRRGRRLSVLEKHTAELKAAQERASEGELNAIDAEILTKAALLGALPHPSQAVAPTLAEPKQVASSVLGSVPSVPRGPTFH